MANVEEDYKKEVNVKKVVKCVKSQGSFALYSHSADCNLLITGAFILNLSEEQFWEVQCALLAKEVGVWFTISKDGLIKGNPVDDKSVEVTLYFKTVNEAEFADVIGFTELVLKGTMLYAGEGKYLGIKEKFIDMLGGLVKVKKLKSWQAALVSDYHIVGLTKEPESQYLVPLLF